MSAPQLLRHLHLPSITPFSHASTLQATLVSEFLTHKALISSRTPPSPPPTAPTPTLLTFTPSPVYTTGRREIGTLTTAQIALLKQPLLSPPAKPQHAEIASTLRGGQITFHGPGQLVIYPILDLKAITSDKWPRGLSVRCYVNLLEEATMRTLAHFHIASTRTDNPGVWVNEDRKIAALGVHLRRNITSYGVGLNVSTDLRWFDRIVACGLEGKEMTTLLKEGSGTEGWKRDVRAQKPTKIASVWAREFSKGLWGEDLVVKVQGEERAVMLQGLVDEKVGKDEKIPWRKNLGSRRTTEITRL